MILVKPGTLFELKRGSLFLSSRFRIKTEKDPMAEIERPKFVIYLETYVDRNFRHYFLDLNGRKIFSSWTYESVVIWLNKEGFEEARTYD